MSVPSSKEILVTTLATCLLVGVFCVFFAVSKHNNMLVEANVFLEDPYDAVGSFGIQLAVLGALFSIVRILRSYSQGMIANHLTLIIRGEAVALLAVAVTLWADEIALLRYLHRWTGISAGWLLAGSASGLLTVTTLVGWRIYCLGQPLNRLSGHRSWYFTLVVCLAGTLVLMFYPEGWRQRVHGVVFTALVGMAILFLLTASIVKSVFPTTGEQSEDFLDDLTALYKLVKLRTSSAGSIFRIGESASIALAKIPWIRWCINWLNPRKHAWRLVILVGLGMGMGLLGAESMAEGAPMASKILMVVGVYNGIEAAGVLLGYALFKQYLGIFHGELPGAGNQML